ncbi:MAG: tRNA dihydrouridine synthase DusB [Pseudomonadales bacterium]|jgi:tRNA-dihydrouridine synthase B
MLTIGPFTNTSQVVVAPMAGVSDQPFRNLCRHFGAQWVVSEMVTSNRSLWNTPKSRQRLRFHDETEPRWIQIAGSEPEEMALAAQHNVELGAQIIDINMGCPAKKVCNKAAGSALLRNEILVANILESVVNAVKVPVTLKIRLGWSRQEMNAERIAYIAQEAGIALLSVHGRTRECRFNGDVDYEAIGAVKSNTSIPVIANGDITSPEQARQILLSTAADGVMLGRAVQGRPWLPAIVDHYLKTGELLPEPSREILWKTLKDHIETLSGFYGETTGVRIARKHIAWYLKGVQGETKVLRQRFNKLDSMESQLSLMDEFFSDSTWAA